jgi:hypothetical protein
MQIQKHIHHARSILFWQDLLVSLLYAGIFASLLFLIGIELETVFYFLPKTKIYIISFICVILITYCLFWTMQYFRSESDKIDRYKIETISLRLGHVAFPEKKDTILNALQLELSSGKNESKELAKSYINKISQRLGDLNYSILLKDTRLEILKKGLN